MHVIPSRSGKGPSSNAVRNSAGMCRPKCLTVWIFTPSWITAFKNASCESSCTTATGIGPPPTMWHTSLGCAWPRRYAFRSHTITKSTARAFAFAFSPSGSAKFAIVATNASAMCASNRSSHPARFVARRIRCASRSNRLTNGTPTSGVSRNVPETIPSSSRQCRSSRTARCFACNSSPRTAPQRCLRPSSRNRVNPPDCATANRPASALGTSATVLTISAACANDTRPAANASAVSGHDSNARVVSKSERASRAVVPVSRASHADASENPAARCAPHSDARTAARPRAADNAFSAVENEATSRTHASPENTPGSNSRSSPTSSSTNSSTRNSTMRDITPPSERGPDERWGK